MECPDIHPHGILDDHALFHMFHKGIYVFPTASVLDLQISKAATYLAAKEHFDHHVATLVYLLVQEP